MASGKLPVEEKDLNGVTSINLTLTVGEPLGLSVMMLPTANGPLILADSNEASCSDQLATSVQRFHKASGVAFAV